MPIVPAVELRRRRLNASFKRAEQLKTLANREELEAEYARHLCVLASGFVEKAIGEIIVQYSLGKTAAPLHSFVATSVGRFRNLDKEKLLAVIGAFDFSWRNQLDKFVVDERLAALNSVVGLRNDIAHGGGSNVSLAQMSKYWAGVQEVVDKVAEILLAPPLVIAAGGKKKKK